MVNEAPRSAEHSVADYVRGYESEGRIRGFRCPHCAFSTATWGLACSRCGSLVREEIVLADRGAVVSFTIVEVPTEEMVNDAPYAYVLVRLDDGASVSGWMPTVRSGTGIRIGDRVRLRPSYRPGIQFEKEAEAPKV